MIKVMSIVGTRPELIKMSRVIAELDNQVHHILVHSGQNYDYELNQIFFDDLEIRKPDYFLGVTGETAAKAIADVISKADDVLTTENPDAVLFYGDTNTCLAVIAAKRKKIPVFHMEAGNRCFDQRVPEELNRKVLDHLSDINMVLTEHARRYLISEGIRPETIIKTGSHMHEVLEHYKPKIMASDVLERECLTENKYFIVSAHREENVDTPENLHDLLETLRALADTYKYPIIVSTHPRTQKRLEAFSDYKSHELIRFVKPFGFLDYIKLQMNAFCILSDSGTITEESSLLNLPAVMIRYAHERPEGMDVGTLIMSGLKKDKVIDAVRVVTSQNVSRERVIPIVSDYQDRGAVSKQVVRVVLSYVDYINRTVWSKY
ncbi:non-hydrolyzing UDP-N-acetylglucosamine 2-epimerase [Legionella parisiensis]|uniref:UDP-2,3-diacetamido-2,3-dideoxy-D-glucuronate 2-epimerase n=1 Tax=Legionella parisiensis TaxID=45071 RepID=A0A1E5JMD4_9GAMM|nr:UDP-N-acetylglucosamine 2-epimerase (non-hydrolyzing) [Legionella parisiensis]KTD42641.1 UDP-N-acetylglucosamine 2-epimerase [Legionella parisiensis]OEH45630.1 UDP-2,3-diacetamido-2,3-dideoxy-D-glucuronate 2-epimerase [Legionella parisiensis]STX71680.1 UDP-N-acetylglucosamine 2-epimerase [Legionella parisiensis]